MSKKRKDNVVKLDVVQAPEVESAADAVVVLESMLADLVKKSKNSKLSNNLASNIVAKSMGINVDVLSPILAAQEEERAMNMQALKIAIATLKEKEVK